MYQPYNCGSHISRYLACQECFVSFRASITHAASAFFQGRKAELFSFQEKDPISKPPLAPTSRTQLGPHRALRSLHSFANLIRPPSRAERWPTPTSRSLQASLTCPSCEIYRPPSSFALSWPNGERHVARAPPSKMLPQRCSKLNSNRRSIVPVPENHNVSCAAWHSRRRCALRTSETPRESLASASAYGRHAKPLQRKLTARTALLTRAAGMSMLAAGTQYLGS